MGSLRERLGPRKGWQNGDVGKGCSVTILNPENKAVCVHKFPLKEHSGEAIYCGVEELSFTRVTRECACSFVALSKDFVSSHSVCYSLVISAYKFFSSLNSRQAPSTNSVTMISESTHRSWEKKMVTITKALVKSSGLCVLSDIMVTENVHVLLLLSLRTL